MKKAKDIDAYLADQPKEARSKLEKLREIIHAVAPGAEEVISYGMPAFKYKGYMLCGFAGYKHHCGFYPWNGSTVLAFKKELKEYKTSAGAIQFPLDKPIPATLVKKIVKFRVKENSNKKK